MRGMTVCSGIGAPEVAAPWIDWRWQAEIDPFPCHVLHHRIGSSRPLFMPDPDRPDLSEKDGRARRAAIKRVAALPETGRTINLGDMTQFERWPDANPDVLVGGTPCQSFSVAGLRNGLDDPRGNLMLTFLALARRYRPRWIVWENVPGVLSTNAGRDFGTFLAGLGQCGYGWAYRVLDAQYVRTSGLPHAVPQRRRRVFVVGCARGWASAAAVLFEREGLRGDPPPRREAGQSAPTVPSRRSAGGGLRTDFDCDGGLIVSDDPACTLTARERKGALPEADLSTVVAHTLLAKANDSHSADLDTYVSHALRAEGFDAGEDGTGRGTPLVPMAFSSKDHGGDVETNLSPTLRAGAHDGSHANAGVPPAIAFPAEMSSTQAASTPDLSPALSVKHTTAVAFDLRGREGGAVLEGPHETANMRAASGGSSRSYVAISYAVRRLTPLECERLQGFPDGWTAIPYRGKPADQCPDGPRYKALGNSWAVNCGQLVFERLRIVDAMLAAGEVAG
ncbi:MAG: DNA cytosine methyltransferase [Pseudomonadota bacterium]